MLSAPSRQPYLGTSGRFASLVFTQTELTLAELVQDGRLCHGLHWQVASGVSGAVPTTEPRVRSLLRIVAQSRFRRGCLFQRPGWRTTNAQQRSRQAPGGSRGTDEAVHRRGDCSSSNRIEQRPFFLYLPHTMLHNPLGVSEEFQGSSNWGEYGDAIQELDHSVGRIVECLKTLNIDNNTIVILRIGQRPRAWTHVATKDPRTQTIHFRRRHSRASDRVGAGRGIASGCRVA